MTDLIKQPTDIAYVRDIAFTNINPPLGTPGLTLWGDQYELKNTWDPLMGWFTGLSSAKPRSQHQVSTWKWWPGATGIQVSGDEIGISLHSWSLRKNLAQRGNLGTIVLGQEILGKVRPFTNGGRIRQTFDIRIPTARVHGGATAQVVAYIYVADMKNKSSFWYGINLFDRRGTDYADTVQWDNGTKTPIVTGMAGGATRLLDPLSISGFYRDPYTAYRRYDLVMGEPEIRTAVNLLRGYNSSVIWSDDMADYQIGSANINPEIHVPGGLLCYAHLGLSIRDWSVQAI